MSIGSSSGKAQGKRYDDVSVFLAADDAVIVRLRLEGSAQPEIEFVIDDENTLLSLAACLVQGVVAMRSREESRARWEAHQASLPSSLD